MKTHEKRLPAFPTEDTEHPDSKKTAVSEIDVSLTAVFVFFYWERAFFRCA